METTHDFTKLGDFIKFYEQLNFKCKVEFIKAGFESAPECEFSVESTCVFIICDGTKITFYSSNGITNNGSNVISFGGLGGYTPDSYEAYWRMKQAASIVRSWDALCPIVDKYCKLYESEIIKVNNL